MSSKKKDMRIRIDDDTKKILEERAEKEDKSVSELVRSMIHKELNPEITNKYKFLDDGCNLREYVTEEESPIGKKYGEGFYCLKKAPTLIKLGSGLDSIASKICSKCQIREEGLENSRILSLIKREGIKIEMPICTNGGRPSEDLKEMWCPLIGKNRPIKEKKNKKDYTPCRLGGSNNARCKYLMHKVIVTGLKEKDNR